MARTSRAVGIRAGFDAASYASRPVPQFPFLKEPVAATTGAAQSVAAALLSRAGRVATDLRKRLNFLGLASKDDAELQGRLVRKRVTIALDRFSEAQGTRDESLIESVREELRRSIEALIAALDDDLYADEEMPRSLDEIAEPDELDLIALEDLDFSDD
jgi:hypothetical protein